ncbi:hypothetical protein AMTRI_Chr10g230140 [Amborella trichopoda]
MSCVILKFAANIKLILCYIFEGFWTSFFCFFSYEGNRNLFPFLSHELLFLGCTYEVLWSLSIWVYAILHLGECYSICWCLVGIVHIPLCFIEFNDFIGSFYFTC